MSSPMPKPWTVDDFLAWERQQEERWEFVDGIVRMMVGGTLDHSAIYGNVFAALKDRLRGSRCRAFVEGVKVVTAVASTYPDVVVTCAEVDGNADVVPEPVAVIEVLSRSTTDYDHGRKWIAYQTIDSLQHYVLISQDEWRVECYTRQGGAWEYAVIAGQDATLSLSFLNVAVPLATIYESTSLAQAPRSA